MDKRHYLGKQGELIAQTFLLQKDCSILEKNWRFKKAEIDLIAMDKEVLVFVEVKTRSTAYFGAPEEFVSIKKQLILSDAASVYMDSINHQWEIRFDVIAIIWNTHFDPKIQHFKDAFFPGID